MTNRNATPSAFGWDFQINAGIVIMVKNIYDAKGVKIEGATEDIEVELQNGEYIFAQAKSCMKPDDNTNAGSDLNKALETLSEADGKRGAKELLFVTNRSNPLSYQPSIRQFATPYARVRYDHLPIVCQNKINKICKKKKLALRTDRFSVVTLEFSGDGDSRYEAIKTTIAEFLVYIDSSLYGFGKKMLDRWQLQFGKNASQNDRTTTITKKDMMWALIVLFCEGIDESKLGKFDGADSEDIKEAYAHIIDWHTERFDLFCKVGSEYAQYKAAHLDKNGLELQHSFVEEKSEMFADDFDLEGLPPEIAIAVRKITIDRILQQHHKIAKVKEKVNL